jgi:hypothetical protein
MKIYCLLGSWSLLLLAVASAGTTEIAPADAPLKLEGVKPHYELQKSVAVVITNGSDKTVMYGIGVQRQGKEKWEDFATNIGDREPYAMQFGYSKLQSHHPKNLIWNPKPYPKGLEAHSGTYRFFVAYQVGDNDYRMFYSEPFKIED